MTEPTPDAPATPTAPDWAGLVAATFGADAVLARTASALPAFAPPWAELARRAGWILWLGHPPVPDLGNVGILPAPPELVWGEPVPALTAAAGIALAYAQGRGAADFAAVDAVTRREGPVAVVVPDELHDAVRPALVEVDGVGVPILLGAEAVAERLAAIPAFAARRAAHAAPIGRPHDPALAFQSVVVVDRIGGNPLSSFVLHHEGERDGVTVTGQPSTRAGIEVGVRGPALGLAETADLERRAADYPGFLDGVTSHAEGHGLVIGWQQGGQPTPGEIGEALRAWLKALDGADLVDVRIVFAPPTGRSAVLADMRARATAFTQYRADALAGAPLPPDPEHPPERLGSP